MPPAYVRPYVKRQKNDALTPRGDFDVFHQSQHAVGGATRRPSTARDGFTAHAIVFDRAADAQYVMSIRAHLAEFGIVAPVCRKLVT